MHFAYTILYVPDVPSALDHYEAAFGLVRRFLHESGTYGEMETGATRLAFAALDLAEMNFPGGVLAPAPADRPPPCEIAFATEDVAGAYHRALAAGAAPVAEPVVKPWGQTVAYVRDPAGHLVELCTPMG